MPVHRTTSVEAQECGGGWTFFLITAEADAPSDAYAQLETDAVGWFTLDQMRRLPLHPGFRQWVEQRESSAVRTRADPDG